MYPVYDDDEAAQSIIHQYMAVLNWHAEIFAARDFGSGQLAKRVCDVCLVTIGAKTVGTQVAIVSRSCREVVIALHTAVLRRAHDDELFV